MVSRVPLDSTTTPTSIQGLTEADPTADRHRLFPKARHGTSRSDWRIFGAAIAAIIVLGLAVLFFARYRSLPAIGRAPSSPVPADAVLSAPGRIAEKSIAVLPFENRSEEKENAYFADGIAGRDSDPLIQHCGSKSDFAHFHAAISEQTCQSPRDREAARCREHP